MAREPIYGEEFVRHFQHLRDRTGNNPSGVMRALKRHPDLASCVKRLHEIEELIKNDRKFDARRIIVKAHPEFRKALDDFRDRWSTAYVYARDWLAAKDFVRHHRALVEQTGDRPSAVRQALDQNRDLGDSIETLHEVQEIVEAYPERVAVFQEYPEFLEALNDFKLRWPHAYNDYQRQFISVWEVLGLPPPPLREQTVPDNDEDNDESHWHFDPDRDSIAYLLNRLEAHCYNCGRESDVKYGHGSKFGLWAEGLAWLRDAVGLNFEDIETRWKEFPVIIIPGRVSDKRYNSPDPPAPQALFGYLTQIRLAYIIGADVAAVALCRSTTELLIQYHYPSDQTIKNDLPGLIRSVQRQPKFAFLKQYNLVEKVRKAHDILHGRGLLLGGTAVDMLPHQNPARGLVRDWVKSLYEMISEAQ